MLGSPLGISCVTHCPKHVWIWIIIYCFTPLLLISNNPVSLALSLSHTHISIFFLSLISSSVPYFRHTLLFILLLPISEQHSGIFLFIFFFRVELVQSHSDIQYIYTECSDQLTSTHASERAMNRDRCEQPKAAAEATQGSKHTLLHNLSGTMTVTAHKEKIDLIRMQGHICPHICHNIM